MHTQLSPIYYIIFTAITSLGVLLQAVVLLGIYLAIRKTTNKLHGTMDEVKARVLPLITTTRDLLEDISPKIKVASGNVVEISETLKDQSNHLNNVVGTLVDKTSSQISRIDEMVTATLDSVEHATATLERAVSTPVRRISGIINGLRAGVDVFLHRNKRTSGIPYDDEYPE